MKKRKLEAAEKRRIELENASKMQHQYRLSTGSSKDRYHDEMKSGLDRTVKSEYEKSMQTQQLKTGGGMDMNQMSYKQHQATGYNFNVNQQNSELVQSFGYENDKTVNSLDMNTYESHQ